LAKSSSKYSSLQPLLKWPGGKSRVAKRLIAMFPEHDTYVEPMVGSGAVFFRKPLVKKNVIGDMDPWLADFYKSVRGGGLRQCAGGIRKSKGLFGRVKNNPRGACKKMAQTVLSFHGDRRSFVGTGKTAKAGTVMHRAKLKRHKEYQKKLRAAYLRQSDYASTMRKFDGLGTVHFLDPPWLMKYSDKYKGKSKGFNFTKLKKDCDSMQGYVMIIINNKPELRKLFCKDKKWKCRRFRSSTNKGREQTHEMNLLLIKGFTRKKKKRKRAA